MSVYETGMAYERCVIEDWFGFHSSDPNTGVELGKKKQLAPNKCGAAEADRTAGE